MARRPKQHRDTIAPRPKAGSDPAFRGQASGKKREEKNLQVEWDSEKIPVTPREIELLSHYLGAVIDDILGSKD